MSNVVTDSISANDIAVGDQVSPMDIDVTTTAIVAGAIASHDWMPMHHDRDFAQSQGAPDVFLNIFSTNAYIARFLTDWAGPEAFLKNIDVRLGVQAVPGQVLSFRGEVLSKEDDGEECCIQVSVAASNQAGDHATGTATLTLPKGD